MKIAGMMWDWKDEPEAKELNMLLEKVPGGRFVNCDNSLADNYGLVLTDGTVTPENASRLVNSMAFYEQDVWETEDVEKLILELEETDEKMANNIDL